MQVSGTTRARSVVVRLRLNRAGRVRVVLVRGKRDVLTRTLSFHSGQNSAKLKLPKGLHHGPYVVRVTVGGRTLTARVRL